MLCIIVLYVNHITKKGNIPCHFHVDYGMQLGIIAGQMPLMVLPPDCIPPKARLQAALSWPICKVGNFPENGRNELLFFCNEIISIEVPHFMMVSHAV